MYDRINTGHSSHLAIGLLVVGLPAALVLFYVFNVPRAATPTATPRPSVSLSLHGQTPTLSASPSSTIAATAASTTTPVVTATPTATNQPTFPLPVDEARVEALLAQMTLEQKVGQMLMVGLPQPYVDGVARRRIMQQQVGGIIFLERNTTDAQQVTALTQALQALAREQGVGLPLFIGWNHEGGPVVRTNAQLTAFPSAMALGAANQPQVTYQIGQAVGQEMLSLGVNVNFAPVLDVNSETANPVIGLRAFGDDPALVADMGRQLILGQQSAGIIAVAKHFPGHGGVDLDSHVELPLLSASLDVLHSRDLPPFQAALYANVGGVMVAHLQVPALEPDGWPASLSARIIDGLLRGQMGFDGVVMTDDMGMGAIANNHSLEEATVLAVLAGNDLLLSVETESHTDRMRTALLNALASGRITPQRIDQSVRRIIRLKLAYDLSVAPPTLSAEQELSYSNLAAQAGREAVTVLQDANGWLPLQLPMRRILLLSPSSANAGLDAGDGLSLLGEELAERGVEVVERFYNPDDPWSVTQLQSQAASLLPGVDAVVVLTWNAILRQTHFQDLAQETLVAQLLSGGQPVVVVFSQLPYDRLRMPHAPAQIATYGDTAGQMVGLVEVLVGD